MKERPIIFSGADVRAILEGRKTQMRRLIDLRRVRHRATWVGLSDGDKGLGWYVQDISPAFLDNPAELNDATLLRCPYGKPDDRLWVRETWRTTAVRTRTGISRGIEYKADGAARVGNHHEIMALPKRVRDLDLWRSPIQMPRWASRLTLAVTSVRVQRLQEISEEDALAEGIQREAIPYDPDNFHPPGSYGFVTGLEPFPRGFIHVTPTEAFAEGWDQLNGKRAPWASNPWVWATTFEPVRYPLDNLPH